MKRPDSTHIVETGIEIPPGLLSRNALARLPNLPQIELPRVFVPWPLAIALMVAWCGGVYWNRAGFSDPEIVMAMVSFPSICVSALIFNRVRNRGAYIAFITVLDAPYSELVDLHVFLHAYIQDLDRRTSKYIHVVTNSKVSAYFSLIQIRDAIGSRVDQIEQTLSRPTRGTLLKAYHSLQGTLTYSDGALATAGNMQIVPLGKIASVVANLIQSLEAGLKELEEEIQRSREELERLSRE